MDLLIISLYKAHLVCLGWSFRPWSTVDGEFPRHFFIGEHMSILSIFIDESGDFDLKVYMHLFICLL